MPTANYVFEYVVPGTQSRDITVNVESDKIDKVLGGYLVKGVGGSVNITLTVAEYRYRSLEFTGVLTGNVAVIVPSTQHLFTVYNNTSGAFTLTVKTLLGSGLTMPPGVRVVLLGNGTDIFAVSLGSLSAAAGMNIDITSLSGLTTPLSAPQGGTGQSTYTVGDLLYASATNALSLLADVAAGRLLISGGVGVAPAYSTSPSIQSLQLRGGTSGIITVTVDPTAGTWTLTLPTSDGNAGEFLRSDGSGVTSWVLPINVESLTDAATVTPSIGTDGRSYIGILTSLSQATNFANPTGTSTDGQMLKLRITSTSSQSVTWGTKYKGSAGLSLPYVTYGNGLRNNLTFQYCVTSDTYDLLGTVSGVG